MSLETAPPPVPSAPPTPPPVSVPPDAAGEAPARARRIIYPETDGKPIGENTEQFRWIVTIENGLEAVFAADPNVFVAGDLFWYPVEGHPEIVAAPDAMVVFGRPKGKRPSYLQWLEGNIPPQVVFEVLSPGNTPAELIRKFQFYDGYGVEEYYVYDPDRGLLNGWVRDPRQGVEGSTLVEVPQMEGWVSPRLHVRFGLEETALRLYRPDGEPFTTYLELMAQREAARREASAERERAERAQQQADQAQQQADQVRQQAEHDRQRAERLAARLRELGVDPETI